MMKFYNFLKEFKIELTGGYAWLALISLIHTFLIAIMVVVATVLSYFQ